MTIQDMLEVAIMTTKPIYEVKYKVNGTLFVKATQDYDKAVVFMMAAYNEGANKVNMFKDGKWNTSMKRRGFWLKLFGW